MAKHWTELTRECGSEVAKTRHAFLAEHRNADQLFFNNDGVPIKAIYFTPEMPGYGKTYDDVLTPLPPRKDVNK